MTKKVLLLDDSLMIIEQAKMALQELIDNDQIVITEYLDPNQFLHDLKSHSIDFDLLLSDINMPEINGLDVVKEVKSKPEYAKKPIIMMTTESSGEMKQQGKALGVTGWIVKPFNNIRFSMLVSMVLGLS